MKVDFSGATYRQCGGCSAPLVFPDFPADWELELIREDDSASDEWVFTRPEWDLMGPRFYATPHTPGCVGDNNPWRCADGVSFWIHGMQIDGLEATI